MKNMKYVIVAVIYIAFAKAYSIQAQQEFTATADFIVQTKFNMKEKETTKDQVVDAEKAALTAQIRAALAKGSQQEYSMHFTPSESYYTKVQQLEKPKAGNTSISFSVQNGSTSSIYKNLQEGQYYKEDQIMGKEFLIVDDVQTYNWQLTNETKKIGNYTCYKAIYTPEIDEEEQAASEKDDDENESNSLLAMIPDEDPTITAWYTPEIPVSNGPGEYQGLPGFILEVKERNTILLCTKVEINPAEGLNLKKPKSGKKINQKDFDALREKKWDERKANNNGNTFLISSETGG
jgi:GLPGLI family protein